MLVSHSIILIALQLLVGFLHLCRSLPFSSKPTSLYTSNDPVNILYTANATNFISGQHADGRKLQLVQFYSSWCGHCIDFAPHFKKFLGKIPRWKQWIDVSAVDCSREENTEGICQEYGVTYYPTLRMFWLKPTTKDIGDDISLKDKSAETIQHTILKWVTDNWKKGGIPPDWPSFVPITASTLVDLNSKIEWKDNRPVVIIVEKDDSFVGRELMAHFFRWREEVKFYRIVESDARLIDILLPNALDKFMLPFLFVAKGKEDSFKILPKPLGNSDSSFHYYRTTMEEELFKHIPLEELNKDAVEPTSDQVKTSKEIAIGKKIDYPDKVHMSDLHNAIRYALYHEIPLRMELDVEQTNALIRFLAVLHENFPFPNIKTKEFIKKLQDWLSKTLNGLRQRPTTDKVTIKTSEIKTTMDLYEEYYHFPEMKPWRACANVGGKSGREYPCSLWTLFHVLTVVEYRRAIDSGHWENLHPTLFAMREYIRNFFSCKNCAEHFVEMAKELEVTLTRSNSSVLWLWYTHNQVNARLKGSSVENGIIPKRQFPTVSECPYCYKTMPLAGDTNLENNASEYRRMYYNDSKVLQFLVTFYGTERVISDDEEGQEKSKLGALEAVNDKHIEDHSAHPLFSHIEKNVKVKTLLNYVPFTSIDYSILFLFYLISIGLLVGIYFLVKIRKNRRNRKFNF